MESPATSAALPPEQAAPPGPAPTPSTAPAPGGASPDAGRLSVLEPKRGWQPLDLKELWRYRELLWFMALRDIKVRYKQTALGVFWAILQPFLTMVALTVFFGKIGGLDKHGAVAYPVQTFCALLPWQLFEYALSQSGNSLVASERLITKVYFPRLVIPLSAVASGLLDFAIAFLILIALMAYYRLVPGSAVLTLPLFVLLAVAAALAVGLWLSALNVQYRDVRYAIPFFTRFWMLVTPVAYTSDLIRDPTLRALYGLNPMAGVVEGFRWALLPNAPPPGWQLAVSASMTVLLLVGGLFYFRRMEKTFADLI